MTAFFFPKHDLTSQIVFLKERNDLRNLVDSCQREVTMTTIGVDPRIEALEKLVNGYRKRIEVMEEDPQLAKIDMSPTGLFYYKQFYYSEFFLFSLYKKSKSNFFT